MFKTRPSRVFSSTSCASSMLKMKISKTTLSNLSRKSIFERQIWLFSGRRPKRCKRYWARLEPPTLRFRTRVRATTSSKKRLRSLWSEVLKKWRSSTRTSNSARKSTPSCASTTTWRHQTTWPRTRRCSLTSSFLSLRNWSRTCQRSLKKQLRKRSSKRSTPWCKKWRLNSRSRQIRKPKIL